MISEDRLQKALTYLAETDEPCAKAKGLCEGLKAQEKSILALGLLNASGTIAEREAHARVSPEFKKWRDTYEDAVATYETFRNKRNTESQIIEVWRSLESTKRASL